MNRKFKIQNVSLREDMLEPTFVTLEEAIQRQDGRKGLRRLFHFVFHL